MAWTVETLDHRVDAELDALSEDLRVSFVRIVELIEAYGPMNLDARHIKHLEGKLWEMRLHGADGIARAIYVVATRQRVVVVHAFVKKTQKIPPRSLELARRRAKEVR